MDLKKDSVVESRTLNTPEARSITTLSEVKAISEETLDDALFKIPADYKRLDTH